MKIPKAVRKRANEYAEEVFPELHVGWATVGDIRRRRSEIRDAYLDGWIDGQHEFSTAAPGTRFRGGEAITALGPTPVGED